MSASPSPDRTRFTGEWRKDAARSDPLDCACDALQLQGMVRGALGKMDRISIDCDGSRVRTRTPLPRQLFIPLGAVVEEFEVGGGEREHKRRDNRPGQFKGRLVADDKGGFAIKSQWSEPLSGTATDTYSLSPDGNTLTIAADLSVEGRQCKYSTVYTRVK